MNLRVFEIYQIGDRIEMNRQRFDGGNYQFRPGDYHDHVTPSSLRRLYITLANVRSSGKECPRVNIQFGRRF